MHKTLVFIFMFFTVKTHATSVTKCCENFEEFRKVNDTYQCVNHVSKRWQIITNDSNFLKNNKSGVCVEALLNKVNHSYVSEFKVDAEKIEFVKNISLDYRNKCCPLNYFFNSKLHSCTPDGEENKDFQNDFTIRVGLPHCKLIVDYINSSTNKFEINKYDYSLTVDDGETYSKENYCRDQTEAKDTIFRICMDDFNICDSMKCIRKCCPDGQSFINGSHCRNTYVHGVDLTAFKNIKQPKGQFAIIHGYTGKIGKPNMSIFEANPELIYQKARDEMYCIEYAVKESMKLKKYTLFLQLQDKAKDFKFLLNRWVQIVSSVFLLLTIGVYLITNKVETLFGKILVSFCSTLFVIFVMLIYSAFQHIPNSICVHFAFWLQYMMHSVYTWLNIMCLDIYWTLCFPKSVTGIQQKTRDVKRFLLYSLYGWGFPLVLVSIVALFYYVDVLPEAIKIHIGDSKCFIWNGDGNYGAILFSIVPNSIIVTVNVVLFIKTISYCWKVKGEIQKMNDTHGANKKKKFAANKERFVLIIKLLIIMGSSFLFEVVSSFYDFKRNNVTKYVEYVWDFINSMQGVFIFLNFVCKREILNKFQNNIGFARIRKMSRSSGLTQSTNVA